MEKFARRCDATGCGMNEGFVIGDGEMYLSTTDLLLSHLRQLDYLDSNNVSSSTIEDDQELMDFFYNDEYYYFTEWEEIDDDVYYDKNGNEHENV
jgi:hypothetical protein